MTGTLLYLTALEHLAHECRDLPEMAAGALKKELPAAKLGGLLADLPLYGQFLSRRAKSLFRSNRRLPDWMQTFHCHKPTALAFALAEIAQTDADAYDQLWPVGFVCGYATHLAIDRTLNALVQRLVKENRQPEEDALQRFFQIRHYQTMLFHREVWGRDLMGSASALSLTDVWGEQGNVLKPATIQFILKGCLKAFGFAPKEKEVSDWLRGFQVFRQYLRSPLSRWMNFEANENAQKQIHTVYRNDFFDFHAYYNRAIDLAHDYMGTLVTYMKVGDFSPQARDELMEIFPELDVLNPPDEDYFYAVADIAPPEEETQELTPENIVPFRSSKADPGGPKP